MPRGRSRRAGERELANLAIVARFPQSVPAQHRWPTPSAFERVSRVIVEEIGGYVGEFQPESARWVVDKTRSDNVASQEID